MSATIASVSKLRAELWDAGFRPVPVFNHDAKVPSAGKQALGEKWQIDARKTPPFCATSPAVPHALNTGILTDRLRPIDIGVDDPRKRAPASPSPWACWATRRSERAQDHRAP
jgi:hypothetical protein